MTRINNALRADIPERLETSKNQLENLYKQVEDAKRELKKPFAQERELAEKETRGFPQCPVEHRQWAGARDGSS
jgi:hypothetical protein